MNGLPATKLWDSPVEAFFWDGRLSIRDKFKKTIFFIELDTREYHTVKKLREQIVPQLVELMNEFSEQSEPFEMTGPLSKPLSNGQVKHEWVNEIAPVVPKRRGNPNWIKGMKRK